MKKNNSGSALMEMVLAAGMLGIITYSSVSLMNNNNKAIKTTQTSIESQDLATEVSSILASTKNCSEAFIGQELDVSLLDPKIKSTLWESGTSFTIKQENESHTAFEDRFPVGVEFGIGKAIKITSYTISEDETHSFDAANKSQYLMLNINFERKESSYVRNYRKKFPIWLKIDEGNLITDCRSLQSEDQIWKRSKVEAGNIYYDSVTGGNAGLVTIGASTENGVETEGDEAKAVHISKNGLTVTTTGLTPDNFVDGNWPKDFTNKGALINSQFVGVGDLTINSDSTFYGNYTIMSKDSISSVDEFKHGFNLDQRSLTMSTADINTMNTCAKDLIDQLGPGNCASAAGATYAVNGFAFGDATKGSYMAGNASFLVASQNGSSFHLTSNALLLSPTSTTSNLETISNCADFLGSDSQNGSCEGAVGGIYSTKSFALGSASAGYIAGNPSGISGRNTSGGNFWMSADKIELSPNGGDATTKGGFKVTNEMFFIGTGENNFRGNSKGVFLEGMGQNAGMLTFQTQDGNGQAIKASSKLHLNGNEAVKIDAFSLIEINGGVGINLNATQVKVTNDLQVVGIVKASKFTTNGNLAANDAQFKSMVSQNIAMTSDRRLKTEIQTIENALAKILQLNGVTYYWKNPESDQRKQIGLIAQDIQAQFPEAVNQGDDGFLSVNYMGLLGAVVESIRELYHHITGLNEKVIQLESQQKQLEQKIKQQQEILDKQQQLIQAFINHSNKK